MFCLCLRFCFLIYIDCRFKLDIFPFIESDYYNPTIDTDDISNKWMSVDNCDIYCQFYDINTGDEFVALEDTLIKEINHFCLMYAKMMQIQFNLSKKNITKFVKSNNCHVESKTMGKQMHIQAMYKIHNLYMLSLGRVF